MNLLSVLLLLFLIRTASVFLVRTYFVPDEYWQSLEVAHKLVFGYGYLTWEWTQGIRSYIYPLIVASIYKLLAIFKLDRHTHLLLIIPRLLHALLSTYSDYRFIIWCGKKKWALFSIITSWFWFYITSRTLMNTLETALTIIALSYFPWQSGGSAFKDVKYMWIVAFCCYVRPTAIILWLPLITYHMKKSKMFWFTLLMKRCLPIGLLVWLACIGVDSWMYNRLILTPYEFFKYNIYYNIGTFYGSHKWYWYFTNGLPSVLGVSVIPFICGVIGTLKHLKSYPMRKLLLIVLFLNLVALSFVEHKEFRFLSSLLPLCLYITADTLTKWSYKASRFSLWCVAIFLVVGNMFPALYFGLVHQRGPIEAINRIHDLGVSYRDEQERPLNVLFLMPCHSTPFYSHIHQNITMRFLTCEPNLKQQPNYEDEAEQFYQSPNKWLRSHVPSYPRTAKPTHVVLYDSLTSLIPEFLLDYKMIYKIPNGELANGRIGKNVLIYQRLRSGEENLFNRDGKSNMKKLKNNNIENEYQRDGNIFN